MSDIKNSLHVLSPGDKSYPHCHSVITGRKSWKTLKGKTEAVWPPYLEVALFEGASPRPPRYLHPHLILPASRSLSLSTLQPQGHQIPRPIP